MDTETTETDVVTETNEGEGETRAEVVTIPKTDWEKTQQTLGSLKRELKDLKKPKEPQETPTSNQKPESVLLQELEEMALDNANISHSDDIELARNTAKKWGMPLRQVLKDEDFKVKLEKQQTARANVEATSGVKGSNSSQSSSKAKSEYWIGKNTAPTDDDVAANKIPREELSKIMAHFVQNKGTNKKFYND